MECLFNYRRKQYENKKNRQNETDYGVFAAHFFANPNLGKDRRKKDILTQRDLQTNVKRRA